MRQTVSVEGADDAAPDEPVPLEPLELQPVMASAAAATPATAVSAADLFLSPTPSTPSALGGFRSNLSVTHGTETNWKLSYKIGLLQDFNNG
jgi:hypothetical protein